MPHSSSQIPTLVCEIANSHAGNRVVLEALIDAVADLDYPKKAIKFQVFAADTLALPDFEWHSVYRTLSFDRVQWQALIERGGRNCGVWIDIFDSYGVEILKENLACVEGIKLQASVLENQEVRDGLGQLDLSDKDLTINVSGHELDDIRRFITVFREYSSKLSLQIGFQSYPTAIEDTALQKIAVLRAAFPEFAISMADHSPGEIDFATLVPIYAHSLGCSIIEKHFCLNREAAKYDGYSALEPAEMQLICARLLELDRARIGPFVSTAERDYLMKSIQRPIARHSLRAGERINLEDLLFRRTAQIGLSLSEINAQQKARRRLGIPLAKNHTLSSDSFRPANVSAVIACRMKSSRLRKKAILPLGGIPSVERCLIQCLGAPGIDQVVLATSDMAEDQVLREYTRDNHALYWAGDPDDVIARYIGACDAYGIDIVVRVTADCPLISREIITHLLDQHFRTGADYTAARNCAVGTSGEIIEVSALRRVNALIGRAEYSEYMTWYFQNNPHIFKLTLVDLPHQLLRNYRLTLDYLEDQEVLNEICTRLDVGRVPIPIADVFDILDRDPDLAGRNGHIGLKYRTDQDLIDMLNKKTRIEIER